MLRALFAFPLAGLLAACTSTTPQLPLIGGPPQLTPVGQGLAVEHSAALPSAFVEPDVRAPSSLWSRSDRGMFRDIRARKVGDIVTVTININDQAQFDNTSGRSKQGGAKGSLAAALGFSGFGIDERAGELSGTVDGNLSTTARGEGKIDRSEKLNLAIAAVVTDVLPGGNLLISGSQEVRVNNEIRVLTIGGIVRPLDIGSDNLIAYHKIAEARVSYGGRGKLSDVQ